jgi:hypothetical protein
MPLSYLNIDVINPSTVNTVVVSGVEIDSPTTDSISVGTNALSSVAALGIQNIAIGTDALSAVTTQTNNVAIGNQTLELNTGGANTAVGSRALEVATNCFQNDAFGAFSLLQITTGSFNTALGGNAGGNLISGTRNTFLGFGAGSQFTSTGDGNVIVGNSSGYAFPGGSGDNNTFIGKDAGWGFSGGNDNVILGKFTTSFGGGLTGNNNIQIGTNSTKASLTASNSITLGNSSNNILRCAVTSITSLSDARDKKGITELSAGLDFVNTLKPVSFVWDDRDEEGRHDVKDFGFIAQDLKKSQEDAKLADTLKLVYEENPEKLEASYGKLIPILVKAIQDLSKEIEILKNNN